MIKFEYIQVSVTWTFDDLTEIKKYADNGWRFTGYSPVAPYIAYFERKLKIIHGG